MASYDHTRGEIVLRIVYDGLGTAGKTTNLKMLHAAFLSRAMGELVTPDESKSGRTLFFDWLELDVGFVGDWRVRCQVISVPGQFVYAHRRFHLLREIDGAVLVCDSTESGVEQGAIAMTFLRQALESLGGAAVPIVLQANKQDRDGALPPEEVARRMPFEAEAVVPAVASTGDGVRLTLFRVLDLARSRVRERLAGGDPRTDLPPRTESAEALHAALISSEEAGDSTDLVDALESAMALVK